MDCLSFFFCDNARNVELDENGSGWCRVAKESVSFLHNHTHTYIFKQTQTFRRWYNKDLITDIAVYVCYYVQCTLRNG